MIYEIQSRNDLSAGAMLVVRIPEEDLDRKALDTLETELPDFVVPFRYRLLDGEIEFTYLLGTRSKLQYLFGSRTPAEYIKLWSDILNPLLDCADWFMKPFSFVLDTKYLFVDKNSKIVSYLYIPSMRDCSDYEGLREMATELSKQNTVTDSSLENKALRAIMQDFNPKSFLQILREFQPKNQPIAKSVAPPPPICPPPICPSPICPSPAYTAPVKDVPIQVTTRGADDDIVINLSKKEKPEKTKKKLFGGEKKEKKEKSGLFSKKKEAPQEIVLGAAAQQQQVDHTFPMPPAWMPPDDLDGATEIEDAVREGALLRLIGDGSLPSAIQITISEGQAFTIGRFDVSVGRAQSSFEFDKKTKAVSRRHAVIERSGDTYAITDLSSSAGTFVNGERLLPNVPRELQHGARVAFGTSGADYIWEA